MEMNAVHKKPIQNPESQVILSPSEIEEALKDIRNFRRLAKGAADLANKLEQILRRQQPNK